MSAGLGRARVALRLARRGAVRSWGRSLLVVALVAAPVTALTGAAVLIPSTRSTLAEREVNTLGQAEARLDVVGTSADRLRQGVEGGYDYETVSGQEGSQGKPVDPRGLLPAGTPVIAITGGAGTFRTAGGLGSLEVTTGRTWDASLEGGPYVLLAGRAPRSADEVLVTPAAAKRLGTRVGGTIRMTAPTARSLRVVGFQRDRAFATDAETVFGATGLVPGGDAQGTTYFLPSTPLPWSDVQRLNRAGITAFSRAVLADPPRNAYDPHDGLPFATVALVGMALIFVVLEVALLAGAAFAVGARLQQRTLAVVASTGGDRRVLAGVVSATGLVLGLVGGLIGAALGTAAAIVLMRLTDDGTWTRYPGLHLVWPLLVGIVLFGAVVGWLSALVPARIAARTDVVAALRGARVPQRIRRRTPVVGLVLLVGGVAISLLGGTVLLAVLHRTDGGTTENTLAQLGALALLGGGPVLAQLGVVLCAGLLLRTIARLLTPAPLAARLAARDTSRNLGRAVPAVAVIMSTVFVAAFVMCAGNAASIDSAATWGWQAARIGQASIGLQTEDVPHGYAARAAAIVRQDLPVTASAVLSVSRSAGGEERPSAHRRDAVPYLTMPGTPSGCSQRARAEIRDLRCGPFTAAGGRANQGSETVTVGTADGLAVLLGHRPTAAALDVLRRGGAVALRSDLVPGGRITIPWYTPKQLSEYPVTGRAVRTERLPAVVDLPEHPIGASLYITGATAERLRIRTDPERILVDLARTPTPTELDRTSTALGALVNAPGAGSVNIETGPTDYGALIAWWVLLACLVVAIAAGATAIGLARVDGKADDATFAAVGAPPRIRRGVAAVQALLICGVGAVVGTALGLVPAVAIGQASQSFAFAPPVLQLVLTALGIPVVIALGSAVLIGRRTDLARRPAMA